MVSAVLVVLQTFSTNSPYTGHEHTPLTYIPALISKFNVGAIYKNRSSLKNVTQRNPDQVPSTVQKLLTSTQRLQEVLRLWSVGQASEGDVSDTYVQIGNELNLTISAFAQHQIDMRYTEPVSSCGFILKMVFSFIVISLR